MIKEMWNRNYRKWLEIALFSLLIGAIILFFLGFSKSVKDARHYISLMDLNPMDADNKYVEFIYDYVIGNISDKGSYELDGETYYSEGYPNKMNIILLDGVENHMDRNERGRYHIVVEVDKKLAKVNPTIEEESKEVDALLDKYDSGRIVQKETVAGTLKSGVKLRGQVKKMDTAMLMRYQSYFRGLGYNYKDIEVYCLPYYIKIIRDESTSPVLLLAGYILGFGLIGLAVLLIGLVIIKPKQRKLLTYLSGIDANELARAENDYLHSKEFDGGIRLGEKYAFFLNDYRVAKYENVLWMFVYVAGQYEPFDKNKEKMVKKDCLYICDDKGTAFSVSVRTLESGKSVMENIARRCPGVILGYADETKRLYLYHTPDLIAKREEVRQERNVLKQNRGLGGANLHDFGQYMREKQEDDKNSYAPLVK